MKGDAVVSIKEKMNGNFRDLQGGLFSSVSKADVGEGVAELIKRGVEVMA